jgi:hypothetical protein
MKTMQNPNGERDWRVIESDQQADAFLSALLGEQVALRLCSVRCKEAQMEDAPNQDYARVVIDERTSMLSFCVCDGVGGSFQGQVAARELATRLTHYLLALPGIPRHSRAVAVALRTQLDRWASEAQQTLQQAQLPSRASALEQEILVEQRDQHGSATVFFGGRVEYAPSRRPRRFEQTLPALLCWMGNVTARVWAARKPCEPLGDGHNDRNRWSTRFGQQGQLTVRVSALNSSEPLVVYTDGLASLGPQLALLDDHQLQQRMWEQLALPASDDMTVLELHWAQTRRARTQRMMA